MPWLPPRPHGLIPRCAPTVLALELPHALPVPMQIYPYELLLVKTRGRNQLPKDVDRTRLEVRRAFSTGNNLLRAQKDPIPWGVPLAPAGTVGLQGDCGRVRSVSTAPQEHTCASTLSRWSCYSAGWAELFPMPTA